MSQFRNWRLWVALGALSTLLLLAAGIAQVEFSQGFRLARTPVPNNPASPSFPQTENSDKGNEILMLVLWVALVASVLSIVLWPKNLKETLQRAVTMAVWVLAIYLIITRFAQPPVPNQGEGSGGRSDLPTVNPKELIPGWNEMQVPLWFTLLILAGASLLVALGIVLVRRYWRQHARLSLQDVADVAGQAAQELRAGADLRNVVLHCYREMSVLLSEQKKVKLRPAMTAREFERRLQTLGVRNEHVHRLTRLFEGVRYGYDETKETDEHEAVACLEAISNEYKHAG